MFRENPKNLKKWEIPQSQINEAIKVANNAEEAFKIMLPRETQKVNYLADESAYFTNQTFREARRVVMIDYTMAREQFVDMGE